MIQNRILIIIVTYNAIRHNWIQNCLNSIAKSTVTPDVFIVDNNSTDATCAYIRSLDKKYTLVESEQNLGFGKANNLGLEHALKHNYDYVFLLNQDAYLESDTLEKLLSLDLTGYGIISPLQLNGNGNGVDEDFLEFLGPRQSPDFLSDGIVNGFNEKINKILIFINFFCFYVN